MTLPLNSRLSALYDTNGTQKDFSFGFRVFFDPDNGGYGLEVRRQTADGYEVIPKSDYLVLPVEDNSAGVVRFSVAPSAGQQIYIAGKTPTIQQLVLTNFGRYSAESIETQFDFITAIIQEWLSALGEETRQRIAADDILTQYVVNRINDFVQQINQNWDDKSQEIEDYIATIMPSFTQTLREEIEAYAVAGMQDAIDQTLAESKAEIDDAIARANAAATAAAITGKVYDTPEAGVDPVTGVQNGAYYNVRSTDDDSFLVEYQNVGGVATPSGKSYPSSAFVEQLSQNVEGVSELVDDYVTLPFEPGKTYQIGNSVLLSSGDVVRATIPSINWNPNIDMSGWELAKEVINVPDISALISLPDGRVSSRYKYQVWGYGGGEFAYTSSNISAKVKADPGMGLYIPYPLGSNGSQGGFVRNYDGGSLKGQWFGIKSQAGYDNYQAIRNAVIAAVCLIPNRSDENPTIKLPAGKIEAHQNNVLGDIDFASYGLGLTFASGVRFQGQGITSTRLVIVPNGQPMWVYDSLTSTNQRVLDMHFLDMSIRAETEAEMELVDLFRIYSTGVDKRFRFWRCMLRGGHIFSLHGNGNADLHRLEGCSVAAYRSFLNLNNRQAVAIEAHSTDISVYRDFVVIGEEGGGSFKQFGGNLEMHAHPTDTSDHFLFKDTGNTGARMGLGNCDFLSQGVRYEIHGANKKIFYANRTSADRPIIYTIDNGQFGTVIGGTRQAVYAKGLNIVIKFKDTTLNDNLTFYAESAASMSGGANAPVGVDIRFKDCCSGNSAKLAPRCTYTGDKVRFSSIGTYQLPSATSARPVLDDFEFGWTTGVCNRAVLVKTVNLTNGAANTLSASTTKSFTFPAGAYIKRLSIKSAASGSSTVPYKICVGHLASNTIIASSTGATVADAHNILVEDVGPFNYDLLSVWAETESGSKLFTGTLDYI